VIKIRIKGKKLVKIGNSYYLNVPVKIIESGILSKNKIYSFNVKEDDKNTKPNNA